MASLVAAVYAVEDVASSGSLFIMSGRWTGISSHASNLFVAFVDLKNLRNCPTWTL